MNEPTSLGSEATGSEATRPPEVSLAAQVSVATLSDDLQRLADLIDQAARSRQGESIALLALLRLLEQCHREICETLFRDALPDNRQNLYALLRDIDLHGGWPYIQRMKLRSLFANCPDLLSDEDTPSASP